MVATKRWVLIRREKEKKRNETPLGKYAGYGLLKTRGGWACVACSNGNRLLMMQDISVKRSGGGGFNTRGQLPAALHGPSASIDWQDAPVNNKGRFLEIATRCYATDVQCVIVRVSRTFFDARMGVGGDGVVIGRSGRDCESSTWSCSLIDTSSRVQEARRLSTTTQTN